jgi:chromosome partitioning protein
MPHAAYIAFAPADAARAEEVAAILAQAELQAQLGGEEMANENGRRALHLAVADARCMVVVVSPAAEASEAVRRAIVAALNNAKPIVPLVIEELRPDSWLRFMIEGRNPIHARPLDTPQAIAALIAAVRAANASGRVISMLNIKGGVGKTVLAANLFAAAHMVDSRSVVFVDLDPQHNLSQYFLAPIERNRMREENRTLFSVLSPRGEASAHPSRFLDCLTSLNRSGAGPGARAKLDIAPGDDRLFEFTLDAVPPRDKDEAFARFHQFISVLRAQYQAVVIDTNPCATFLTRCAITASDHIVAPVRPERYSLSGLSMLEWVTREIRERPLRPQEFSVLLNGVGDRVRSRLADVDAITRNEIAAAPFFGSALISTAIPYSGLLRATPDERYAFNPINATAIMRLAQRSLKEALTTAAAEILRRAAA